MYKKNNPNIAKKMNSWYEISSLAWVINRFLFSKEENKEDIMTKLVHIFLFLCHKKIRCMTIQLKGEKTLANALSTKPLKDYWLTKCDLPAVHQRLVNCWDSFSLAVGKLPHHCHNFLTNWILQMMVVRSIPYMQKIGHHYRCPHCNECSHLL